MLDSETADFISYVLENDSVANDAELERLLKTTEALMQQVATLERIASEEMLMRLKLKS